MPQTSSGYGAPPPVSRRDSQDQIHGMTQRMKQMTIQSQQPIYQNDGYGGPRSPYDHVQSSYVASLGNERGGYFQTYYTPSAAPPGNSYSNVVSRGKDGTVGKKCSVLFFVYCAVPENIHTPPMEGFLFCAPPPPPGNSCLASYRYFASKILTFNTPSPCIHFLFTVMQ